MSARDDVLGRVRSALRQKPTGAHPEPPAPRETVPVEVADVVGLFVERVEDYRAVVVRCGGDEVADRVREGLAGSTRVVVPAGFPPEWLPDGVDRTRLQAALREAGVPTAIYYPLPLHRQPAYAGHHDGAVLPVSDDLSARILALPIHPDLSLADAERVCDAVMAALG